MTDTFSLPDKNIHDIGAIVEETLETPIPIAEICAVMQARELSEDKWYEGEKHDREVDYHHALTHWIASGHAARFREMFEEHRSEIQSACAGYCGSECAVYTLRRELGRKNGMHEEDLKACKMPKEEMHWLIERIRSY
jgi:hypothetical protein